MVEGIGSVTVNTEMFDAKSAGDPFGSLFANITDSEVFSKMWYENRVLGRSESEHEGTLS